MKRNTKIIIIALTVVGITSGTVAFARGGHGSMGDRMVERLTERLELNEQQVSALDTLRVEITETRELVRGNSGDDRQTLVDLVTAESFDQGRALEMITQRTSAMQTQAPELVAAAAGFLDGLDAEQKQELNEIMDRIGSRRGHRHDKDE
ncbi:MAG: Spy/CpxP family protein refolding chaperone [Granulosicoccus sp.]